MRIRVCMALGSASHYSFTTAEREENFKHHALSLTAVSTDEWEQAWSPCLLPKEAEHLPQDLLYAVLLGVEAGWGLSTKRLSLNSTTC